MRAKKMTENQFNEAKEKIQRYFEEINNEISFVKNEIDCAIEKITNKMVEYLKVE